jgi:hypothetical protein
MNFLASGLGVEYPRGTLYQVTRQVESVLIQPIQVCRFFTTFDRWKPGLIGFRLFSAQTILATNQN